MALPCLALGTSSDGIHPFELFTPFADVPPPSFFRLLLLILVNRQMGRRSLRSRYTFPDVPTNLPRTHVRIGFYIFSDIRRISTTKNGLLVI